MFIILDASTFLIRMNGVASRIIKTLNSSLAELAGTTTPDLLIGVANELTAYRREVQDILATAKTSGEYRQTILNVLAAELGPEFNLQRASTTHRTAINQAIDVIANLLNTKSRAWGVDNGKLVQQAVSFTAAEASQVAQKLQLVRNTIIGN